MALKREPSLSPFSLSRKMNDDANQITPEIPTTREGTGRAWLTLSMTAFSTLLDQYKVLHKKWFSTELHTSTPAGVLSFIY